MDVNDLKEQVIAWWIDAILFPGLHFWDFTVAGSPGLCPTLYLETATERMRE